MLSRAIREGGMQSVSASGYSRVAVGQNAIIVGESDGSLRCFAVATFHKASNNNAAATANKNSNGNGWFIPNLHEGQVTSVIISRALDSAFTCGRDGKVYMLPGISRSVASSATASSSSSGANSSSSAVAFPVPTPIQILNVTGELNAIAITPDGKRLFMAGDSVRCFLIETQKIHTVPLTVPHPILSIAVSSDGCYVAAASASGSVGVTTFLPNANTATVATATADAKATGAALPSLNIKCTLPNVMPIRKGGSYDAAALKLSWVHNPLKQASASEEVVGGGSGIVHSLYIPTDDGVQIHGLIEDLAARLDHSNAGAGADGSNSNTNNANYLKQLPLARMKLVGKVAAQEIDPLTIAIAQQISKHKTELVIAGARSGKVMNFRVDDHNPNKIKEAQHTSLNVSVGGKRVDSGAATTTTSSSTADATVHDLSIDASTGVIAVVDSIGIVSMQKQFAAVMSGRELNKDAKENTSAASNKKDDGNNDNNNYNNSTSLLKQETQLVIGGVSQSQNDIATLGKAPASCQIREKDVQMVREDGDAENTSAVMKDLLRTNPNYYKDLEKMERRKLKKQRQNEAYEDDNADDDDEAARRKKLRQSKKLDNVPSFVENEAEEGSSDDDAGEGEEDEDYDEEDEESEGDLVSEDPRDEARRVEEEYKRRYGLDKKSRELKRKQKEEMQAARSKRGSSRLDFDDFAANDDDNMNGGGDDDGYENYNDGAFPSRGGGRAHHHSSALTSSSRQINHQPHRQQLQQQQQHRHANVMASSSSPSFYTLHPGATPFTLIHGPDGAPTLSTTRYLAFNSIGAIRACPAEASVFVHFHDMTRTTIKVTEKRAMLCGALGLHAFALVLQGGNNNANNNANNKQASSAAAAAASSSEEGRHVVYYRPFKSVGLQSDWSVTLPENEFVTNLAIGNRYLAVFTTAYLRIFSLSGLEITVLCFPHHVVAATGYNSAVHAATDSYADLLAIVYSTNAGDLYSLVLDVSNDGAVVVSPAPFPLSSAPVAADIEGGGVGGIEQSTLQWVGWSDEGILHSVDSFGVVRRLHKGWGQSWVPIYDPTHRGVSHSSERLWVWGATSTHLMVYRGGNGAASSPGGVDGDAIDDPSSPSAAAVDASSSSSSYYPLANDTLPPVERVTICIPLLRAGQQAGGGGDKSMLVRDAYLRDYAKLVDKKLSSTVYDETLAGMDAMNDKELLKQFEQAVNEGKSSRAIDIANFFQLINTLDTAARYANDKQERIITEKLLTIVAARKKLKRRRLCRLPLASDVSEKDRDRILKKLLESEKSCAAAIPSLTTAAIIPTNSPQKATLLAASIAPQPLAHTNLLASPPKQAPSEANNNNKANTPQSNNKRVVFEEPTDDYGLGGGGGDNGGGMSNEKKPLAPPTSTSIIEPRNLFSNISGNSPMQASTATAQAVSATTPAAVKKPANPFAKASTAAAAAPTTGTAATPSPAKPTAAAAASSGAQQTLLFSHVAAASSTATQPKNAHHHQQQHQPSASPLKAQPPSSSSVAAAAASSHNATAAPSSSSPPKKQLRTEETSNNNRDDDSTTMAAAPSNTSSSSNTTPTTSLLPPLHHAQQKLTISKGGGFAVAVSSTPVDVDAPTQTPHSTHESYTINTLSLLSQPPAMAKVVPPPPPPTFNNIVVGGPSSAVAVDPFAGLGSLNESSMTGEGLAVINASVLVNNLNTNSNMLNSTADGMGGGAGGLLAALKRSREDDDEDDDEGAIKLAL